MALLDSDLPAFPTLYELSAIGVGGALEATTARHFCSDECLSTYILQHVGAFGAGYETLSVDGEVCENCSKPLEV